MCRVSASIESTIQLVGSVGCNPRVAEKAADYATMDEKALARAIRCLEKDMQEHARNLEFEKAAAARDELFRLRERAFGADRHDGA